MPAPRDAAPRDAAPPRCCNQPGAPDRHVWTPRNKDNSIELRERAPLGMIGALCCALLASGCSVAELSTADRLARGLVIVLPGIEGRSAANVDIARGLDAGGVDCGVEIYDWNAPLPFLPLVNLTFLERNRDQARALARRIDRYQRDYPGRDVFLIGHSGGAGVAIMTLEALPPGRKVTAAVLLGAAISPQYDLRAALRSVNNVIVNCYSRRDILLLEVGTGLFGTIDRRLGPAAGAVGFDRSERRDDPDDPRLVQVSWSDEMGGATDWGGHFSWTGRRFVRFYLAPLVIQQLADRWPAGFWRRAVRDRASENGAGRR
jgi:pimeloyl-ACP methyl ester carboxylesterase